eukprot:CAMPEP_0114974708 /NCGR_PEP_ID=MMETSP0216-20121206/1676_1 /TAXON_ID=223996 /ORGANISM="Protocruzia adherens, Strain Boccale" /LENGTH=259 /DNA_ID=CAMNT_0002335373 /DNA_START=48 /DNA_END=827 /DNA_ORIENTATION=+
MAAQEPLLKRENLPDLKADANINVSSNNPNDDSFKTARSCSESDEEEGGIPDRPINPDAKCHETDYYRPYFNLRTSELSGRLRKTLICGKDTWFYNDEDEADLYGPFWISTTLILVIAATGDLLTYMLNFGESDNAALDSDLTKLSTAGSTYMFSFLFPTIAHYFFNCNKVFFPMSYIVSVTAYSFFVYIPVGVFCIIPYNPVRIGAIVLGGIRATYFMATQLTHLLDEDELPYQLNVVIYCLATHGLYVLLLCWFYVF